MDRIILEGIEVYAYGGVTAEERRIGQRYRATLILEVDLSVPGESDAIEDTIHYGEVHAAIVEALRERPFKLIESAAERVTERILQRFPIQAVTVRLKKLLPPIDGIVASAAVEMRRERRSVASGEPEEDESQDDEAD